MRYVHHLNPKKFKESFVRIFDKYQYAILTAVWVNEKTKKLITRKLRGINYAFFAINPKLKDNTIIVETGK